MRNFYSTIASVTLVASMFAVGVAEARNQATPLASTLKAEQTLKLATVKEQKEVKSPAMKRIDAQKLEKLNANIVSKARAQKAAPASLDGKTYVGTFNDEDDDFDFYFSIKAGTAANDITLEGLANGMDVNGTYNPTTGKITIPVNVSLGNNGYGDVTLYSLDSEGYYSGTTPITANVLDDGTIQFENGIYSTFPYGGTTYYDALMFDAVACEANGKITYSTASKTIDKPIYVKKTDETTIQFIGFGYSVLSAVFSTPFDQAVTYFNEYTLNETANTASGEFGPFSNYGSYGDFYFGMIVGGYIDDPIFDINVADNTTTFTLQQPGFMGYPNGGSYSGTNITTMTITANIDIYSAPVEGDDDSDQWEDAGSVTFIDGWVLPAFNIDQFDKENWYEVPLQQNVANKNLYRLVDPYHQEGFPALQYNSSSKIGYIVFDATDPNHVVVNPDQVEAGFANSTLGLTKMYCYNALASYSNMYSMDPAAIVQILGDDMPCTTFKDGVFSLGYYIGDDEGDKYLEYDANFGYQGDPQGGYIWSDDDQNPADMRAYVFIADDYADTSIAGEWYVAADWASIGDSIDAFTVTVVGNAVIFEDEYEDIFVGVFTAENTITFNEVNLDGNFYYTKTQKPITGGTVDTTDDVSGLTFGSFSATYDSEAGTITCPAGSGMAVVRAGMATSYDYAFKFITVTRDKPAAIESIGNDNSNAEVIYYDLQGRKINNPANGLFIRKQGTEVSKVLIKE